MRVCGAEVEWTLQKCGRGFEFTIKIIACHSLSPSFSPMKSIIFLSLAILSFSIHVDGQLVPDWPISQLRLDSSPSLSSCDIARGRDDWGSGPDPLPNALPVVCWLFLCTCAYTKPAGRWPQIINSFPWTCWNTRFIHTSRLRIVSFTARSLSALIHSFNELQLRLVACCSQAVAAPPSLLDLRWRGYCLRDGDWGSEPHTSSSAQPVGCWLFMRTYLYKTRWPQITSLCSQGQGLNQTLTLSWNSTLIQQQQWLRSSQNIPPYSTRLNITSVTLLNK